MKFNQKVDELITEAEIWEHTSTELEQDTTDNITKAFPISSM